LLIALFIFAFLISQEMNICNILKLLG